MSSLGRRGSQFVTLFGPVVLSPLLGGSIATTHGLISAFDGRGIEGEGVVIVDLALVACGQKKIKAWLWEGIFLVVRPQKKTGAKNEKYELKVCHIAIFLVMLPFLGSAIGSALEGRCWLCTIQETVRRRPNDHFVNSRLPA